MHQVRTLNDLQQGETAYVAALSARGSMRRRLQDIGVIEGTPISHLFASPAGDPVAYLIRGAVIALRAEDAATVFIDS